MRMRLMSAAGAIAILSGVPVQGAAPTDLKPSGVWRVDYGEAQCLALRDFRAGDTDYLFGIRPSFGGGTYELMLSRKGPAPALGEERTGSIDFGRGRIKVEQITYRAKETGLAITRLRVPDDAGAQMKSATTVEIAAFGAQRRIATGSLTKLIAALETCADDLEKYWNYGVTHATPARMQNDIRKAFSSDDYPQDAFSSRSEGQSQYVVLIGPDGKIGGCDLIKASGIPSLDFMGCQVITKRVKFSGARDSAGKPVRDTVITPPVRWTLAE